MEKPQHPWTMPVAVEDIPETGLHMEIEAPPAARAGIAVLAGVRELPRLSAVLDLTRRGADVHVAGRVSALVGQTCVVSLEPMESAVDEAVDVSFAPAGEALAAAQAHEIGPDEQEPAEPLVGGKIDLGALATEFLLLGIDPYPRKPGAAFAPPKGEEGGAKPFAALATLKKRLGGGQT
jgi:uncharacterized metal-binding protein YceD (DUF177 family)